MTIEEQRRLIQTVELIGMRMQLLPDTAEGNLERELHARTLPYLDKLMQIQAKEIEI